LAEELTLNDAVLAALLATLRDIELPANIVRVVKEVTTKAAERGARTSEVKKMFESVVEEGEVEGFYGEVYRFDGETLEVEGCPWARVCDLVVSTGKILCPVAIVFSAYTDVNVRNVEWKEGNCRIEVESR